MSRRCGAMHWCKTWPPAALVVAVAGLASCGSPAKTVSQGPQLGDRRELPAVPVTPVDAGSPRPSTVAEGAAPPFPRAIAFGALAEGERIADLAVLAQPEGFLLAWVTYFAGTGPALRGSPRSGGKKGATPGQEPRGATVMVRVLDAEGEAAGGANVISVKADSIGGVSLAAGASPEGEAGLAWVGKDAGIGQVFLTRISRTGEKQAQRMLTHSKDGCSDVALVRHKEGFIVAYVDSREGMAGVYIAKVGKDLQRIGNERLVAQTKGEASDVRMIVRGEELVVAWAEAQQNPALYAVIAARLLAADLAMRGDPARIVLAPQHTKGVELAALGEGMVLGWVEDSVPGASAAMSSAKTAVLVSLDLALHAGEPMRVALPAQASSLALECDRSCRVVVAGSVGDELAFYGFLFEGGHPQPAARLTTIPGVSTEDTNPVIARDWLFFAEDNLRGAGRIRKAKLAWR